MKGTLILILSAALVTLFSCRHSSRNPGQVVYAEIDSVSTGNAGQLSAEEAAEEISRNFSSPIEIANLLQEMNVPYSPQYLASSLKAADQATSFDKAMALGFLGADLGYVNMYEMTGSSIDLLKSIKKLADGLLVGQYIDFETIKRLSLEKSNIDSLMFLSLDSYTKIDKYLREKGRGHLSSLMIVSAWIESQYLAAQVIQKYQDRRLRDRIGEQEYFIDDLIRLISPYCGQDDQFRKICDYLSTIKEKYSKVEITYHRSEPVTAEKDGGLVVTQTDSSFVAMTDKQLNDITSAIIDIRNKLITSR
jgi:hypothetical protein